jgi:hypothetical protein
MAILNKRSDDVLIRVYRVTTYRSFCLAEEKNCLCKTEWININKP